MRIIQGDPDYRLSTPQSSGRRLILQRPGILQRVSRTLLCHVADEFQGSLPNLISDIYPIRGDRTLRVTARTLVWSGLPTFFTGSWTAWFHPLDISCRWWPTLSTTATKFVGVRGINCVCTIASGTRSSGEALGVCCLLQLFAPFLVLWGSRWAKSLLTSWSFAVGPLGYTFASSAKLKVLHLHQHHFCRAASVYYRHSRLLYPFPKAIGGYRIFRGGPRCRLPWTWCGNISQPNLVNRRSRK